MTNKLYNDRRDILKTGDVIAFSGNGIVADLIKWKTRSQISHVGIVFNDYAESLESCVFMYESTANIHVEHLLDVKELFKGVQLHLLSQKINSYNGPIWCHPLKDHIKSPYLKQMQSWLRKKHIDKTPYDAIQALGAGCDLFDKLGLENEPDFSSLFCSELVAKALQIGGVIPDNINPSEETPADIIKYDCFDRSFQIKA